MPSGYFVSQRSPFWSFEVCSLLACRIVRGVLDCLATIGSFSHFGDFVSGCICYFVLDRTVVSSCDMIFGYDRTLLVASLMNIAVRLAVGAVYVLIYGFWGLSPLT